MLYRSIIAFGILSLIIIFIIGLILFLIGRLKKVKKNGFTRTGIIMAGIPTGIYSLILLMNLFGEVFSTKPDKEDLVGKYKIVEVSGSYINDLDFDLYILEFYQDGTFTLNETPYINICTNGEYDVNYSFDGNELSMKCPNMTYHKHIERGLDFYRIEFIFGDPDSGDSIFFQKIET